MLADDRRSWQLQPDATWVRTETLLGRAGTVDTFEVLKEDALDRSQVGGRPASPGRRGRLAGPTRMNQDVERHDRGRAQVPGRRPGRRRALPRRRADRDVRRRPPPPAPRSSRTATSTPPTARSRGPGSRSGSARAVGARSSRSSRWPGPRAPAGRSVARSSKDPPIGPPGRSSGPPPTPARWCSSSPATRRWSSWSRSASCAASGSSATATRGSSSASTRSTWSPVRAWSDRFVELEAELVKGVGGSTRLAGGGLRRRPGPGSRDGQQAGGRAGRRSAPAPTGPPRRGSLDQRQAARSDRSAVAGTDAGGRAPSPRPRPRPSRISPWPRTLHRRPAVQLGRAARNGRAGGTARRPPGRRQDPGRDRRRPRRRGRPQGPALPPGPDDRPRSRRPRPGTDLEDVHAMRVATRRQRAAWRVFGAAFRPGRTQRYRIGLREVAARLGAVRDLDVLLEAADHYRADLPGHRAARHGAAPRRLADASRRRPGAAGPRARLGRLPSLGRRLPRLRPDRGRRGPAGRARPSRTASATRPRRGSGPPTSRSAATRRSCAGPTSRRSTSCGSPASGCATRSSSCARRSATTPRR